MKRLIPFVLLAALIAFASGCSKSSTKPSTDPSGSANDTNQGNQDLANGDYSSANGHYKDAIAKDPSNTSAQFGAAVTEVFLLQDDPEIQGVAGQFDVLQRPVTPVTHTRTERAAALSQRIARLRADVGGTYTPGRTGRMTLRMMTLAADHPDSISKIQAIIKTKVLPKLAYAEARLNIIEAASDFVMLIPPVVTDAPDTIEIDKTEVYVLDAVLNNVQGWLGLVVAYNFDVENGDFEHVNAESLFTPGTDWATLNTGGHAELAAAKANFLNVKTRFDDASAYLAAETDDQSNDLIPQEWLTSQDYADLQNGINQIAATLNGAVDVPDVNDANGQPFALQLYLGRFFVPGIDDLKTVFPALTFTNNEPDIATPITFDDPTIDGIFPDMTNPRWQQLTGLTGPPPAVARNASRAARR